jgi:hypothetical protein
VGKPVGVRVPHGKIREPTPMNRDDRAIGSVLFLTLTQPGVCSLAPLFLEIHLINILGVTLVQAIAEPPSLA